MMVDLSKTDFITLLKGVQPSYSVCDKMTQKGLMIFCGNQHNEKWCWVDEKLKNLTEEELYTLYKVCTG